MPVQVIVQMPLMHFNSELQSVVAAHSSLYWPFAALLLPPHA
jgi:hypothetical protein